MTPVVSPDPEFEKWAEWNMAQPMFSGYHATLGEWVYRAPFVQMCWEAWKAGQAALRASK